VAPELKLIPVCYRSVFTTPLGFALSKILEKIQSLRPAAVPRNGTASQKTFFTIFDFVRATNFSAWLCAQPRGAAGLRTLVRGGIFTS